MEEASDKVKITLRNLVDFKASFHAYKAKLPSYFTAPGATVKTWEFQVGVDRLRFLSSSGPVHIPFFASIVYSRAL